MDFGQIRLMELLALDSPLSLEEFCDVLRRLLGLPEFKYDFENETEWGLVEHENIEYNVSRPFHRGTLEEWDGLTPVGCNFGISLIVSEECSPDQDSVWSLATLVPQVGQSLADRLGTKVYHHRSCFGGENVRRKRVFRPKGKLGRESRLG